MIDDAAQSDGQRRQDEEIQNLLYGVSHDLGAPLRAVVQFSELLQKRIDDRLDEREHYWLQLIHDSGTKGQNIVESLQRYARLLSNTSDPVEFEWGELLAEVLEQETKKWQRLHPNRTKPSYQIETALPHMVGLKEHWQQFLREVINNALLYQPVDHPDHTPQLRFSATDDAGGKRIVIEDNGIGVSEEQLTQLSKPFMRGQCEEDYPGVGMGLSLCACIAQRHGGNLSFGLSSIGGLAVIYSYRDKGTSCYEQSQTQEI